MIIRRYSFTGLYSLLKKSKLKALLGGGQKIAANGEVYLGLRRSERPPVLIYQMGKVGSTSVSSSLRAARVKNYLFDIHFLSKDLNQYKKFYIDSGIVPIPYHIDLGIALRKRIIRNHSDRFKIISMVRDPVGRQISDVFQNPEIMEMNIRNSDGLINKDKTVGFINEKFCDLKTFEYIFEWFNRELKSVFNIDVFSSPFNRDFGWKVYHGENADALVIRMEDLSVVGENVISEFLDTPNKITLFQSNVRSQTPEAKAYNYVKNTVKVDKELCKEIYNSQFVRHFYTNPQIKAMTEKWSG